MNMDTLGNINIQLIDELHSEDLIDLADLINTYAVNGVDCPHFVNKYVDVTYCDGSSQFTLTNPQGTLYRFSEDGLKVLKMGVYYDEKVYTIDDFSLKFNEFALVILEDEVEIAVNLCEVLGKTLVDLLGEELFNKIKDELDKYGEYPYEYFDDNGKLSE